MFNKSLLHIRSESRIPVKIKRPDFRPAGYPVQPQFYGHFLIRNYFGRGRSRTFRSAQDPTFRRKTVALKTTFTKIVDNTVCGTATAEDVAEFRSGKSKARSRPIT